MKPILTLIILLTSLTSAAQRWHLGQNGDIIWNTESSVLPHRDHVEMSGRNVSVVLRYGVDAEGRFQINKSMVWPMLRTLPNQTHSSLMRRYDWNPISALTANGRSLTSEKTDSVSQKGMLKTTGTVDNGRYGNFEIRRTYFPSVDLPALIEEYEVINTGAKPARMELADLRMNASTDPAAGVTGAYEIIAAVDSARCLTLAPGDTLRFSAWIYAKRPTEPSLAIDSRHERIKRESLVDSWMESLVLDTPDTVIDRMFAFSKIRALESIYATKGGPMHGPGGESYYAAIWANDQAEYINPYFPFTGYEYGNESAMNSFAHFARFMNPEGKPIPSSIIAEGIDIWDGAGDRGDAAMIAHGASRFALASGDRKKAETLWPLIEWTLAYCRSRLNDHGVVTSDSDELEGRFESGDANLCTSSLYYDALISASYLAKELGKKNWKTYRRQADEMRKNIESYFGANVHGFDTYRYYDGNDKLRAWICIPLTMGITERKDATLDALFSPYLWTENGLLSEEGDKTFWDRSTLYALRGAYVAGDTERATDFMHRYSSTRLLGEHVPYAIEAWPEGEQRHLSAESGLYGRIITEGLFGIRPTGLSSFTLTPRLPEGWDRMSLHNIKAFGKDFDIEVIRSSGDKIEVIVSYDGNTRSKSLPSSGTVTIKL